MIGVTCSRAGQGLRDSLVWFFGAVGVLAVRSTVAGKFDLKINYFRPGPINVQNISPKYFF